MLITLLIPVMLAVPFIHIYPVVKAQKLPETSRSKGKEEDHIDIHCLNDRHNPYMTESTQNAL